MGVISTASHGASSNSLSHLQAPIPTEASDACASALNVGTTCFVTGFTSHMKSDGVLKTFLMYSQMRQIILGICKYAPNGTAASHAYTGPMKGLIVSTA